MGIYALILMAVVGAEPAKVEVQTLAGETLAGELVEFASDHVTVKSDDKPVTLPIDKITGLSPKGDKASRSAEPNVWVDLVYGSSLAGLDYQA